MREESGRGGHGKGGGKRRKGVLRESGAGTIKLTIDLTKSNEDFINIESVTMVEPYCIHEESRAVKCCTDGWFNDLSLHVNAHVLRPFLNRVCKISV